MIYTPMTRLAMEFCFFAHAQQKDKIGFPYIAHPLWVADRATTEVECCVALLHDVCEDSEFVSIGDVHYFFGDEIAAAVEAITRKKGEQYSEYICRVEKNEIARRVKLIDLEHNTDPQRVAMYNTSPGQLKRYQNAMRRLKGAGRDSAESDHHGRKN